MFRIGNTVIVGSKAREEGVITSFSTWPGFVNVRLAHGIEQVAMRDLKKVSV